MLRLQQRRKAGSYQTRVSDWQAWLASSAGQAAVSAHTSSTRVDSQRVLQEQQAESCDCSLLLSCLRAAMSQTRRVTSASLVL